MLNKKTGFAIASLMVVELLSVVMPSRADSTQNAFYVATSDQNGHVNYDIHLASNCAPSSSQPISYYYKNADGSTRELNNMEQEGYRISNPSISGNTVNFTINSFQQHGLDSPFTITSARLADGSCRVQALTRINGVAAPLSHAQVDVQRTTLMGATIRLKILRVALIGANQQSQTIECTTDCVYGL